MIKVTADMYLFAEGYHDGRMGYEYLPDDDGRYYMAGYEAGLEDRSEQNERGE